MTVVRAIRRRRPYSAGDRRVRWHRSLLLAAVIGCALGACGSTFTGDCDPNYEGACLDPAAVDYDCEGGSGDGPKYTGYVRVVGNDPFGLDRDGNGEGCE